MKLVYINDNELVRIGDKVLTNRGEEFIIQLLHEPKQIGGKGSIFVKDASGNSRIFEPEVIKTNWVDIVPEQDLDVRSEMRKIQDQIYSQKYFVSRYEIVLLRAKMNITNIDFMHYPRARCILLAHTFWEALPDDGSIRRPPFAALCNIAERIFN